MRCCGSSNAGALLSALCSFIALLLHTCCHGPSDPGWLLGIRFFLSTNWHISARANQLSDQLERFVPCMLSVPPDVYACRPFKVQLGLAMAERLKNVHLASQAEQPLMLLKLHVMILDQSTF